MSALERIRRAVRAHAFVADTRGLSTVEYVIILALIAVVGITVWGELGAAVEEKVDDATQQIEGL